MRDFTIEQLLAAYCNAVAEYATAEMASRLVDVERRRQRANATKQAVINELKRRTGDAP